MKTGAPIGGFFALEPPLRAKAGSVWSLWQLARRSHALFTNGRSALNHALRQHQPLRLWLPAYSCESLRQAAEGAVAELHFFPLMQNLSPDCAFLARSIKPGDAVLAIDYFGRPPSPDFLAFVRRHPKILWIEDRAQALYPSASAWGEWVLYSPRKLLGVADGGIIVSRQKKFPAFKALPHTKPEFIHAALLRYEDEAELYNDAWYRAYMQQEQQMCVGNLGMSRLTQEVLAATDAKALIRARRRNEGLLRRLLGDLALLPAGDGQYAPFGFPIRVPDREKFAAYLHTHGIFAAHHWPRMPSPIKEFPFEHALSDAIITLPVDHRYAPGQMRHMAALVRQGLP